MIKFINFVNIVLGAGIVFVVLTHFAGKKESNNQEIVISQIGTLKNRIQILDSIYTQLRELLPDTTSQLSMNSLTTKRNQDIKSSDSSIKSSKPRQNRSKSSETNTVNVDTVVQSRRIDSSNFSVKEVADKFKLQYSYQVMIDTISMSNSSGSLRMRLTLSGYDLKTLKIYDHKDNLINPIARDGNSIMLKVPVANGEAVIILSDKAGSDGTRPFRFAGHHNVRMYVQRSIDSNFGG